MTSPTLFDQPAAAAPVLRPAWTDFPAQTVPLSDEARVRLSEHLARRQSQEVDVDLLLRRIREAQTPDPFASAPQWAHGDLAEAWWSFHDRHPEVYDGLVKLTRRAVRRGQARLGIGMVYEVLRWRTMLGASVPAEEPFKLNNNYRAYYARWIMETCRDLDGVFMTRVVAAERDDR